MAEIDNYLLGPSANPDDEVLGTAGDFAKTLGAGTARVGSNLAAGGRYLAEGAGRDDVAALAKNIQSIFSAGDEAITDTINPATRKLAASALTSDEFWQHPVLATSLKATGMLPAIAATAIPGGLMADALGATIVAAGAGGVINASDGVDEFYKKLDAMSDKDLQEQSPKYKAMRQLMDEGDARKRFNREAQGWGPTINLLIGAAGGVLGPEAIAARKLATGSGNVIGAAERGVLGRTAVGAGEGVLSEGVEEGVQDVTQQQAEMEAGMQKEFDRARTANAALEGAYMGGLFGGAVSAVAGGHSAAKPVKGRDIDAVATTDTPDPQVRTAGSTGVAAKPAEIVANPQNAPTTTTRDMGKADVKIAAPKKPVDQTVKIDPAVAVAVAENEGAPAAAPTEVAAMTQRSPNETLDQMDAAEASGSSVKAVDEAPAAPVTPSGNEAQLDTGLNVPEKPASIAAQIAQIGTGERKAVMLPKGTVVPADALGGRKDLGKHRTTRGVFIYDKKLTNPAEIQKLSKLGRENELLGLGPVSKPEAVADAAAGATPVAVTERTPAGTEVKAAAGTTATLPEQRASIEAQKTPGNVVAVETPEQVLQARSTGRVLPNLQQPKVEREAVALAPAEPPPPKAEPKGKRYSEKERTAIDTEIAHAKDVVQAYPPDNAKEDQYHRLPARRDVVIARLRAMVADAEKRMGKPIQAQIKRSTKGNARSDDTNVILLRLAKDVLRTADKHPQGQAITEKVIQYKTDEALIRAGEKDEVINRRLEEGDRASRKTGGEENDIEQHADTTAARPDVDENKHDEAPPEGVEEVVADTGVVKDRTDEEISAREHDEADVTASEEIEQGPSVKHIEVKMEKAKAPGLSKREQMKARLAPAKIKNDKLDAQVENAVAAGQAALARKPLVSLGKPRRMGSIYTDAEMEGMVPHAYDVRTMRRWVNQLSEADYRRLEKWGVYNFPNAMVDTMEPARVLEAWKQSLAADKPVFLDPGEYRSTIEKTNRELSNPRNDVRAMDLNPSEAQKKAGNYKKGHRRVEGLDFTIENPKGAVRRGVDEDGRAWSVTMPADYGYIRRTTGADGDHVDAYDGRSGNGFFIVDQLNKDGTFDEHKVMMRFKSEEDAVATYNRAFSDGSGPQRLGFIYEVTPAELKEWLDAGDTTAPHARHVVGDLDAVNFDVPEGPRAGEITSGNGVILSPTRSSNVATELDSIQMPTANAVGAELVKFFRSRLRRLAGEVDVHYLDAENMDKLWRGSQGYTPDIDPGGLHVINSVTGHSEIYLRDNIYDDPNDWYRSRAHILLHEVAHAVTVRQISDVPNARNTIEGLMRLARRWGDDNEVEVSLEYGSKLNYSFSNAYEFIAEAFSNQHFQEFLSKIPLDQQTAEYLGLRERSVSAWDAVRNFVRKAIERVTGRVPVSDTVLDGVLKVSEHLTKIHSEAHPSPYASGKVGDSWRVANVEAFDMSTRAVDGVRRLLESHEANVSAPKALKLRTFDNIARIADHYFGESNPVRKIHSAIERMRVTSEKIAQRSEPLVRKLTELRAKNRAAYEELASLMHDATVANVHPDVALSDAKNAHLGKNAMRGVWAKAQHAELSRRFRALPDEYQQAFHATTKHFRDQQNAMSLSIIQNQVLKLLGHDDAALARRVHEGNLTDADRQVLGSNVDVLEDAGELSKIEGPYVPLMRRGDHVVKGDYKVTSPGNATVISNSGGDVEFEFKTQKEAEDYVKASKLQPTLKKIWIDSKTGERSNANELDSVDRYRVRLQNRHVEFVQGKRAALARAAELAADGSIDVHEVVPRSREPNARQGAELSTALQRLVRKLEHSDAYQSGTPTQRSAMRQAIEEAALASHGSTRVSSRALPRRGVKGYSEDLVQNTADYAESSSRYLARLEHGTQLEAGMKEMAEQLDRDHSKEGQYARTAISNEVRERVEGDNGYQQGGALAPTVKRLLSASFTDKLASPAYSIINAMQPGMVTMPYLAARFGVSRTFVALSKAYSDINAGSILKEGAKGTAAAARGREAGRDLMSLVKRGLSADEKRMIDYQIAEGTIDASAGMEVSNLAKSYEGVGGKADAVLGYLEGVTREMPRAIETINRSVTAIATYRLAKSKGLSHDAAVQAAQDAINGTQFNYSPTNAPALFNHPLLKIALQFKKYGQGMYQLIGTQIGEAIRNEYPGDRARAVKTLVGIAATHMAMAGALGLPTEPFKYLVMAASPFTGVSWGDVENEIRRAAAGLFGKTGGEVVTRGLPRLLNLDLGRMGLDSVTSFGEPRGNKEADVKSWLFDSVSGPVVSLGGDYIKGINHLANGEVTKAAEKMIPLKAASDSIRAYRQSTEGKKTASGKQSSEPYAPSEAALRVLGFGTGREAEEGAQRSAYFRASNAQKEERSGLVNKWVQAEPSDKAKAWAAIQKFNQRSPAEVKITTKELTDKARRDAKSASSSKLGITPSKRDKRFLEEGIYNVH